MICPSKKDQRFISWSSLQLDITVWPIAGWWDMSQVVDTISQLHTLWEHLLPVPLTWMRGDGEPPGTMATEATFRGCQKIRGVRPWEFPSGPVVRTWRFYYSGYNSIPGWGARINLQDPTKHTEQQKQKKKNKKKNERERERDLAFHKSLRQILLSTSLSPPDLWQSWATTSIWNYLCLDHHLR